ncbi:hypothetical protein L6R49_16095 [Myxococcota bacterium]|nr:hypothetical protein [Myxococcota bacterium]
MTLLTALSLTACLTSPAEYEALLAAAKDHDGDGFVNVAHGGDDCDDDRADVFPDADEVCDGADNNCDGEADEGFDTAWYGDHDGDGHAAAEPVTACEAPSAEATHTPGGDCDDLDASVSPDAVELCDEQDNNCDGRVDEQEAADATVWYYDDDGDGYGHDESPLRACEALSGTVAEAGDCDDGDATVSPDAVEVCDDGVDNNCDESARPCAFAGEYDLGAADLILTGVAGDEAGWAMCGADLNHDGADDLAIGAPGAGKVYVLYGPLTPGEMELSDADLTLTGASGSELGYALLCADLNDDGGADLAVGAPGEDEVTLWFGPLGSGSQTEGSADVTYTGRVSSSRFGSSLAGAADENGDGHSELMIGMPDFGSDDWGGVYAYQGPLTSSSARTFSDDGSTENLAAGSAVAALPDITGDGRDEWVVSTNGAAALGEVHVVPGPLQTGVDLNVQSLVTLSGDAKGIGDGIGRSISTGDVTGDGLADVMVTTSTLGTSSLWLGGFDSSVQIFSGDRIRAGDDFPITIDYTNDEITPRNLHAADLNEDGIDDLLVVNLTTSDTQVAYLFYGPLTGDQLVTEANAIFTSDVGAVFNGVTVSADINNDGRRDVAMGEYLSSTVYLYVSQYL